MTGDILIGLVLGVGVTLLLLLIVGITALRNATCGTRRRPRRRAR